MNIVFVNTMQSIYYNNTIDFIVYYNVITNDTANSMSWWLIIELEPLYEYTMCFILYKI